MKMFLFQIRGCSVIHIMTFCVYVTFCACGVQKAPVDTGRSDERPLRVLLVADPMALAFERSLPKLREQYGVPIEVEIVGYNDGRRLALLNEQDQVSRYDLIAFDIVWLGEYVEKQVLLDLTDRIPSDLLDGILEAPLAGSHLNERLYGLPVQPHGELLWGRKDLLSAAGFSFPRTTEDLLEVLEVLHDPENQLYGIAWNAQRGQPLGQTMAHLFAAFGQPMLDENGLPAFHTEKGLAAARYAMALMAYSPPDILNMAWDLRTSRFADGKTAMTYGWGARAYMAEDDPATRVRGLVSYGAAPHAPGEKPVTPLGVWSLGVPANVQSPDRSVRFLTWFLQEEPQRLLMANGNGAPPLRSLVADPEMQEVYPVLKAVMEIDLAGEFDMRMRPRVPQWAGLCEILGVEFHEMLAGRVTPEEALQRAYEMSLTLFDEASK